MEENKSKNKKVIVIVAVIVIIVAILAVIGISINDYAQKAIIGQEMEHVNTTKTVDTEIKSTGKYADVEKALKDYILEYQEVGKEIANAYTNESFTTILSANNYKNDGPNFEASKKLINDVKTKGEEAKTKLTEMLSDEYKQKRAEDCGLSGKYKDLFINSIQLGDELKEVEKTIDSVNNYLGKVDDIFNFLKENEGKWEVKSDKIEFKDMSLLTKYNSLVLLVNTSAKQLK